MTSCDAKVSNRHVNVNLLNKTIATDFEDCYYLNTAILEWSVIKKSLNNIFQSRIQTILYCIKCKNQYCSLFTKCILEIKFKGNKY